MKVHPSPAAAAASASFCLSRIIARVVFSLLCATFLFQAAHAAPPAHASQSRTYYIAADEVQWNYAPSGRDEAMGMDFDDIARGYTESGPHQIGRINKKAMYREYTDATFSTLKARAPEDAVPRHHGSDHSRRSGRYH